MTPMRHAPTALLLSLAAGLACSLPARACIGSGPLRAQSMVAGTAAPGLPEELRMRQGDLLTVLAGRGTRLAVLDAKGAPADGLVVLEEPRYLELSAQGGGSPLPQPLPGSSPRLGAAQPGVYYLRLTTPQRQQRLARVEVEAVAPATRGTTVQATAADQDKPVWLQQAYDSLVLTLPGTVDEGWSLQHDGGADTGAGLKLVAVEADAAAPADAGPRVKLRLVQEGSAVNGTLVFHSGSGKRFSFPLRIMPVPKC